MFKKENTYAKLRLILKRGIPSSPFFAKAWGDEPLTSVLKETDIPFSLPLPHPQLSTIAINEEANEVIAQCSTNEVVKYWEHVTHVDLSQKNKSTCTFVKIHQKAVEVEKKYLKELGENEENSLHSAGIAVLAEYRGQEIGLQLRKEQIKICLEKKATTLFSETTNKFSAKTVEEIGFLRLATYSYPDLANELNNDDLKKLDDAFSIWCLKL